MTLILRRRVPRAPALLLVCAALVMCAAPAAAQATPTNVRFAAPGAGQLQSGLVPAKVTWVDADAAPDEQFRVGSSPTNLGDVGSNTFFFDTTGLPDGPHSFTPIVKYASSASYYAGTPITLYIDNTAPTASIVSGPASGAQVYPGAQTFTVAASDGYYANPGVAEVRCTLTNITSGVALGDVSCAAARSFTTIALDLGTYRFAVVATDRRGHASAAAARTFSVIAVPPPVVEPTPAAAPAGPAAATPLVPIVQPAPSSAAAVVTSTAPLKHCVVPLLHGYTLAAAKVRIARANCSVGLITTARGMQSRVGLV
ncbi:MAG: hypothetical protein H7287_00760, partial [Thermoleophilia bacterium]|nr:hypothetical protein [Thermoleophilia bacterium]